MSGGLDSTLLAAVATTLLPGATLPRARLKSFSYAFDELKSCDERDYIRLVVERLGLDATCLPCDDKWTLKDLPRWPVERDYVWSDAYAGLVATVAGAARDAGCRVLLDGHFGDVLFFGGSYWAADLLAEGRWKDMGRALREHGKDINWRADILNHGLRQLVPVGFKRFLSRFMPRSTDHDSPAFHPAFAERVKRRARAGRDDRWREFAAPGQWVRLTAMTESSWSEGYGESRKYYNRFGLEAESPYFDRRLVEFVMALPAEQLGRPWRNRWVQRNAMAGLLPSTVQERVAKTNFEPLMARGLFEREIGIVHTILAEPRSVERNIVRSDWLRRAREDQRFASEHSYELWQIISLELWLQKQSDLAYVNTPV